MTRAPWVLPKPSRAFPAGNVTAVSTTLGWRLVNERMPAEWTVSLGEANELLAERFGDLARAAGRVRRPLAPARRTPPGRRASTTTSSRRSPASTWPATRASGPARPPRSWPGSSRRSVRTAPSPRATPRRSTTVPRRCCSAPRRGRPSGSTRSPGSRAAARTRWRRRTSGSPRSRPPSKALARAGIGWADVAAVELNEAFAVAVAGLRRRLEGRPGDRQRQGRRDRDRPPAGRLGRPHPRHPGRTGCASPATAGAWRRSASASARRWPSCWRTWTRRDRDGVLRGRRRGGGRRRRRLDRADRRLRDGRHAGRADRRADPAGRRAT